MTYWNSKRLKYWVYLISVTIFILLTFNTLITLMIHKKLVRAVTKTGRWPVGAYVYDKKIGFDFAPNVSGKRSQGSYYVKSHQLGYRIGENEDPVAYQPGGLLSLGCSFTYGDEVESGQTFTQLAADGLNIPAYNYGVCSFSYIHALLKAEKLKDQGVLDKLQPKYVVLGCWSGLPDRSRSPFPPRASNSIPMPAACLSKSGDELQIKYPMDLQRVFDLVELYREDGGKLTVKKFFMIFASGPRFSYLYLKNSRIAKNSNPDVLRNEVTDYEIYDFYFSGIENVFAGYDTRIIMLFMPNQDSDELPDKALIDAVAAHPGIIPVNGYHAIQRYDISVRDYMRKHPQPPAHNAYALEIINTVRQID